MSPEHVPSLRGRATITTVIIVLVLIALCLVVWMYRNTPPLSNFLGSGTGTTRAFASSTLGFSVLYPENYTVGEVSVDQGLGSTRDIRGVKFTVPESLTTATNLGADSYISVEQLNDVQVCSAALFVDNVNVLDVTADGIKYSVAQQTGAAAGNLYEETVFALPGTSPCTAVRYFIHSTQIGNYPEGTRTEFDRSALVSQFDQIRKSLKLER